MTIKISEPKVDCPVCTPKTGIRFTYLPNGKTCPDCANAGGMERRKREYIEGAMGCKDIGRFQFKNIEVSQGNQPAYNMALLFNPRTDNAYFWGHNGAGKTFLAQCLAVRWMMDGLSGRFLTAERLRDDFIGLGGSEKQAKIQAFADLDVLVIDELGLGVKPENCDFMVSCLTNVLNARKNREKNGLIFTSVYEPERLGEFWNCRHVTSRVEEICNVRHVCPRTPDGKLKDYRIWKSKAVAPETDYKNAAAGE